MQVMKPLYTSILAVLVTVTIVGMLTISTQQVFAPRNCGGCAKFQILSDQFEKDVINAATVGDPKTIPSLLEQYNQDIRALDLTSSVSP